MSLFLCKEPLFLVLEASGLAGVNSGVSMTPKALILNSLASIHMVCKVKFETWLLSVFAVTESILF